MAKEQKEFLTEEQKEFMKEYNIKGTNLERVIKEHTGSLAAERYLTYNEELFLAYRDKSRNKTRLDEIFSDAFTKEIYKKDKSGNPCYPNMVMCMGTKKDAALSLSNLYTVLFDRCTLEAPYGYVLNLANIIGDLEQVFANSPENYNEAVRASVNTETFTEFYQKLIKVFCYQIIKENAFSYVLAKSNVYGKN